MISTPARPRDYRGDYCGISNDFGYGGVRDYEALAIQNKHTYNTFKHINTKTHKRHSKQPQRYYHAYDALAVLLASHELGVWATDRRSFLSAAPMSCPVVLHPHLRTSDVFPSL